MKTIRLFGLLLACILFAVACQPAEERVEEENTTDNPAWMEERDVMREDMQAMERRIDERITELRAEIEPVVDEDRVKRIEARINHLQSERGELDRERVRLQEIDEAGWEAFKADVRRLFDRIENGIDESFDPEDSTQDR